MLQSVFVLRVCLVTSFTVCSWSVSCSRCVVVVCFGLLALRVRNEVACSQG